MSQTIAVRWASFWGSAGITALVAFVSCTPAELPAPAQPDVLLVVLDTVRADRSSAYGYARPTTIQLSALAEVGVLFEDATAPGSWTLPSHASLFTGEAPWVHGAHSIRGSTVSGAESEFFGMQVSAMREDLPTLAERFSGAGYRSVALVANAWLGPEVGITRGFSQVEVLESDAEVVRAAFSTLEATHDEPLFLFLNLMSAHAPYMEGPGEWAADPGEWLEPSTAPDWLRPYLLPEPGGAGSKSPARGVQLSNATAADPDGALLRHHTGELTIPEDGFRFVGRLYDAGVRGADFSFGQVLARWAERSPDSVVAVTSDHGEAFGEHGLFEHRASVYPEMLRVPLVLAAPGTLPVGKRVKTPVAMHELYGALLELAGIALPDSSSLLAIAQGARRTKPITAAAWTVAGWRDRAGGRYSKEWRLYREGAEALVWSDQGDAELYRVDRDPQMKIGLAASVPDRAAELLARAKSDYAASAQSKTEALLISDGLRERLEALGYAGME